MKNFFGFVSYFSSKVQTSKKFRKRLLLPFCSPIVCYFVLVGASGKTFAVDFPAPGISRNSDARAICPAVCERNSYHWHGQWTTIPHTNQSVCGCGWDLVKKGATFLPLNAVEQNKFDIFQNAIANTGLSPKDAAQRIGDSNYKAVRNNQYQIRLSRAKRVLFVVQPNQHLVIIQAVGVHL